MKLLEDRILESGQILPGGIVKVDGFLNHQMDIGLIDKMGEEFYNVFKDQGVTKILTVEASGIGIACIAARYFNVPVLFAKKSAAANQSGDLYTAKVHSFTRGADFIIRVDKKYLTKPIPKPDGEAKYLEPKTDMVGVIYITPNLSRGVILSYVAMDAVLVLLLGAGGMPAVCEAALERLQAAGVKVYIKSQCMYGKVEEIYAAHSGVKKFIPVKDESIEYTIYRIMFDLE